MRKISNGNYIWLHDEGYRLMRVTSELSSRLIMSWAVIASYIIDGPILQLWNFLLYPRLYGLLRLSRFEPT